MCLLLYVFDVPFVHQVNLNVCLCLYWTLNRSKPTFILKLSKPKFMLNLSKTTFTLNLSKPTFTLNLQFARVKSVEWIQTMAHDASPVRVTSVSRECHVDVTVPHRANRHRPDRRGDRYPVDEDDGGLDPEENMITRSALPGVPNLRNSVNFC